MKKPMPEMNMIFQCWRLSFASSIRARTSRAGRYRCGHGAPQIAGFAVRLAIELLTAWSWFRPVCRMFVTNGRAG